MKNKYIKRSKISEAQFREVLRCFARDLTVTDTADIAGLSRPAISDLFQKIRKRLIELCRQESVFSGEIEVDEAYFRAKRVRGKKGRGAKGKIPVVGLLKRGGKVYTKIVKNCTKKELMPVIQGKVLPESTVYTDGWRSYDGLVTVGYKHHRIHHQTDEFVRGRNQINGIESFWSFTKRRIRKLNGVSREHFLLHLKESEFRWNHRRDDLYQVLLKEFRENTL